MCVAIRRVPAVSPSTTPRIRDRATGTHRAVGHVMRYVILATMVLGCGLVHDAPSASECDHVWGSPSGYMASACCRTQQDCVDASQSTTTFCTAPTTPLPMGFCPASACSVDADCRATSSTAICQPLACELDGGGTCVAGCTADANCADGEACDLATNRCHAAACVHATDCPTNFTCSAGACARSSCTTDSDCDGYCVLGQCYLAAGECRGPVG